LEIARIAKGENLTAEEAIIYSEYMASASARSLKDFIHSRENFSDILKKAIERRKPDFQMSVVRKAQQERTETLFKVQAQKGSLCDFVKSQGQPLIKKISSDEVVQRRFDELAELRHPFHHDGTIKESAIIQWLLQNSLIQGPEITDHVLAQLAAKGKW
jgi:hypothetical protein